MISSSMSDQNWPIAMGLRDCFKIPMAPSEKHIGPPVGAALIPRFDRLGREPHGQNSPANYAGPSSDGDKA